MKRFRYILAVILSLLIVYVGAGVSVAQYCCSGCETANCCCADKCGFCGKFDFEFHKSCRGEGCTATIYKLDLVKQAFESSVPVEPIRSHRYMRDPLSYIREEEMKLAMHVQQLSIVEATVAAMAMQLKQNSHKLAIHSERLFQKNTRSIAESRLRLTQALHNYDTLRKRQIGNISALLDAYSPLKSLSRGYAIAYHGDEVISSVDAVEQNDRLRLRMQDGYLYTNIEKKEKL